jgi:hypothetical protein
MSDRLKPLRRLRAWPLPAWLRECLILLAFFAMTALMTWPWVTRLRDAVADSGDSYAFAWTLWWDYHQTFHDPLRLFHANIFFPYRYTLAFTEHDYGIALLFFPLFALGLRPLTVLSVATFCGFAFCGYGAFRLTRTLTASSGAAWVAGVVFAFIPYRFMLLAHLPYFFAGWLPLLLEALVLFARVHSRRRAVWLGVAFLLNGLSCLTWLLLALMPCALTVALLVVRQRAGRARAFWVRGLLALAVASLLLLPFLWPYYKVHELYGFRRSTEEVAQYSASLVDWVAAPAYNKVWSGMGRGLPGVNTTLFPGLLPILLALAALLLINFAAAHTPQPTVTTVHDSVRKRWLYGLDALCVVAGSLAIIAAGYGNSQIQFFHYATQDRALLVLTIAFVARLCLAYPQLLRHGEGRNLIESLRATRRDDAFWLGVIWAGFGFLCSFGMRFYLYRVLFDLLLPLRSLRAPSRAAMIAYVGLALLAGLGAMQLAQLIARRLPAIKPWVVYALIVGALLFELHAAPLPFLRGAVFPDAVTLRLKTTPMRGGVVELPSLPQPPYYSWHLSMLRAADHGRPVVSAASSFIPPLTLQVNELSNAPNIAPEFLDLLEAMQVSYIVYRPRVAPELQGKFAAFFNAAASAGRLRLVASFADGTELYAVMKTEPDAH